MKRYTAYLNAGEAVTFSLEKIDSDKTIPVTITVTNLSDVTAGLSVDSNATTIPLDDRTVIGGAGKITVKELAAIDDESWETDDHTVSVSPRGVTIIEPSDLSLTEYAAMRLRCTSGTVFLEITVHAHLDIEMAYHHINQE